MKAGIVLGVAMLLAGSTTGGAQQYLIRLDARAQTATYRGVLLDSIPVAQVVPGPGGGPGTPDGFAAYCAPGAQYCSFYRAGPKLNGGLKLLADFAVSSGMRYDPQSASAPRARACPPSSRDAFRPSSREALMLG